MFVSTIIATIGRTSLKRAVKSVLCQGLPDEDYEVIVVNDTNKPLIDEKWYKLSQVKILTTRGRERSVARNTGAAVSRGRYLHFLDDDDYLLPGGLKALRAAAEENSAAWIYGGARLVKKDGEVLADHHIGVEGNILVQVMAGEWLPLQVSLIRTDVFFEVGGFDPLLHVSEDKDLCRKVARIGDFVQTPKTVAGILRGQMDSTTNYDLATKQSLQSRNNILGEPGAFRRMWLSADTSYWRGRMVRAYLTCVVWNLQRHCLLRALGLFVSSLMTALMSLKDVLRLTYWRALFRPHIKKNVF